MQICSARAGTPCAVTSSQVHTSPRGQHWQFPAFIPSGHWFLFPNLFQIFFPNTLHLQPFSLGALCISPFALAPLGACCLQVGSDSSRAPQPLLPPLLPPCCDI